MQNINNSIIKDIATDFGLSYNAFLRESAELFLERKLKEIRIGIFNIARKYGVSTIADFDKLYQQGKIEELASFDDYKTLDRHEYQ